MKIKQKIKSLRKKILRKFWPPAVQSRHWEYSGLAFMEPSRVPPSSLVILALQVAEKALSVDLSGLKERYQGSTPVYNIWPGEHYRLLAGLIQQLRPKEVVEVGTFQGLSAVTILRELAGDAKLNTFDVIPWNEITGTSLRKEDFQTGQLTQHIADLSDLNVCRKFESLLQRADLIFLDAAKDGVMEEQFLANFRKVGVKKGCLIVLDDIRLWNMLAIWDNIPEPKLDLTSFGHWTGTGLVQF